VFYSDESNMCEIACIEKHNKFGNWIFYNAPTRTLATVNDSERVTTTLAKALVLLFICDACMNFHRIKLKYLPIIYFSTQCSIFLLTSVLFHMVMASR